MAVHRRQRHGAGDELTADVAVVGGGVAGCAVALALARRGVDVVVRDAGSRAGVRVGESLPPTVRGPLARLGLWEAFRAEGHAACVGSRSRWGSARVGTADTLVHPTGQGWHVDRARFDAWLRVQAEAAGVRWSTGRVGAVSRKGDGWSLDGRRCAARFVVDATGARARIGRRLGAVRLPHDRLLYLACTFHTPFPAVAVLEAVADGWWYAAGLPGGAATAAVVVDPESGARLAERDAWRAALDGAPLVREALGDALPVDGPHAWIAESSLLGPPAGDRWLAVGDAAACWDPITAHGMAKALTDGLRAASAVVDALDGDPDAVGTYARATIVGFRGYLAQRAALYGREQRFADAPFWRRRHARRTLRRPGRAA